MHLVVEAVHRKAFSSGMRSLGIRCGLRLDKLFGRKRGKVLRDRYHRRDLFSARQVRAVLRYEDWRELGLISAWEGLKWQRRASWLVARAARP